MNHEQLGSSEELKRFQAEEEQPEESVQPADHPRSAPNKGVLESFRRFQASATGRVLEVAAAASLSVGGMDMVFGKLSAKEAWSEFQKHHPERSQIRYETMEQVPVAEQAETFRRRDNQYVDRVNDGLQEYVNRNLPRTKTPALRQALEQREHKFRQALEKFRPSAYDRWLTKSGMGRLVRTDHPFPVVRFMNLSEPVIAGQVGTNRVSWVPDTLYIDTDPAKEKGVVETMEHEYLHTTQWGYRGGGRVFFQTESKPAVSYGESGGYYDAFNEGANELLRGKLNALLKRKFNPMYVEEIKGVQDVEETIGSKTFWLLYSNGEYNQIEKLYNERKGDGQFYRLLAAQ